MQQLRRALLFVLLVGLPISAQAQSALPLVDEVEFPPLQTNARRLLEALESLKAPLPRPTVESWRELLRLDPKTPKGAERVQHLLDPLCLAAVSINPESRVKAARGPAAAVLPVGRDTFFLVRVHNEAGVTHGLALTSPQLRSEPQGWLEAEVMHRKPLPATLSGSKLEYVLLRLRARDAGKREATLKFDVGQGTQDLGFRAEVPILFTVQPEAAEENQK